MPYRLSKPFFVGIWWPLLAGGARFLEAKVTRSAILANRRSHGSGTVAEESWPLR
jgi:hypothetical protein